MARPKPSSPESSTSLHSTGFPVLVGGRIKPIDTVARNSLLIMRGKQTLRLPKRGKADRLRWLADVLVQRPEVADSYPVLRHRQPGGARHVRLAAGHNALLHLRRTQAPPGENRGRGKIASDVAAAQRTPFQSPSSTCATR
jgi:hypothetical protein